MLYYMQMLSKTITIQKKGMVDRMIFSSITFIFYFLPIVLILYCIVPAAYRNLLLLISSLFFYAWGEPKYLLLLFLSIVLNYWIGLYLTHNKKLLVFGITLNILFLFFFKYSPHMFSVFSKITLPLGISFYTFQIMSYLWDVYRDTVQPQKSIIDFACYVTLFPQLIAGPIVRYSSINHELKERSADFTTGIPLFIIGLSEKVLLANNAGLIWEETLDKLRFSPSLSVNTLSMSAAWLSIAAYAFQIYFDFCGYSNMAIGLGRIFGFHFPQNFNKPYTSRSITEFWTRWHISLSSWFKEYVYIPLGGNRRGILLQLRNILIVWMLTGIWHGASLNFLLWGLYFGFLLILEKLFLKKALSTLPVILQHIYAILTILIGWVLFAFDQSSYLIHYLGCLFQFRIPSDSYTGFLLKNNWVLFLICIILSTNIGLWTVEKLKSLFSFSLKQKGVLTFCHLLKYTALLLIFLLSIAYMIDDSYNPFLYFRF